MKRLQLTLIIGLFALTSVLADINSENSTGIEPPYAYDGFKGGLSEAYNLFNGNLHVQVPLFALKGRNGQDVPVLLSYETRQFDTWQDLPSSYADWTDFGYRLGGWTTSFVPVCRRSAVNGVYSATVIVDGTQHYFEEQWPPTEPIPATNATDMLFDWWASKLYMKNGGWIDFSNPLQVVRGDASGNYVQYILANDYSGTYGNWTGPLKPVQIIDNLGRTVNFGYQGSPSSLLPSQITWTDHNNQTKTISFEYTSLYFDLGHYWYAGVIADVWLPLLTRINLPDGTSWEFDYQRRPGDPNSTNTALARVVFPTGVG